LIKVSLQGFLIAQKPNNMEVLIFYGSIIAIGFIFSAISKAIKRHQEKIRDKVYHELLSENEINQEIKTYKDKLSYIKVDDTQANNARKYIYSRYGRNIPKYYSIRQKCAGCDDGYLRARKGVHGAFLGCSNYPKCKNTATIKDAKNQIKQQNTDEFNQDFIRAYS